MRLFARYRDLRGADHFEAYLRKAIVNLSKDQHRKKTIERAYLVRQDRAEAVVNPSGSDEELRTALMKLPQRQRAAVALRYLEDLSEQQTAEAMDTSVAAVKALTQRGAASLRRHLGGEPT